MQYFPHLVECKKQTDASKKESERKYLFHQSQKSHREASQTSTKTTGVKRLDQHPKCPLELLFNEDYKLDQ